MGYCSREFDVQWAALTDHYGIGMSNTLKICGREACHFKEGNSWTTLEMKTKCHISDVVFEKFKIASTGLPVSTCSPAQFRCLLTSAKTIVVPSSLFNEEV